MREPRHDIHQSKRKDLHSAPAGVSPDVQLGSQGGGGGLGRNELRAVHGPAARGGRGGAGDRHHCDPRPLPPS